MRLDVCRPKLTRLGSLRFSYPSSRNHCGEITPWPLGWQMRVIRNDRRVVSYFWALELFSKEPLPGLPGEVETFIEAVPADVRRRIVIYRFGQCFMLGQVARHTAALDLLGSNPNLFWLLASSVYDGRIDPAEVARLCRRKRATRSVMAMRSTPLHHFV